MAVNDQDTGDYPRDESDARITTLYKQSSREAPPAYVDRKIAAAARAEGRAGTEKPLPWWMVWRVPLATAAIAVVSASLIALMLREDPERLASVPVPAGPPAVPAEQPSVEPPPKQIPEALMSAGPQAGSESVQTPKKMTEAPRPRRDFQREAPSPRRTEQDTRRMAAAPEGAPPATEAPISPEIASRSEQAAGEMRDRTREAAPKVFAEPKPEAAAKPAPAPEAAPAPQMRTAPSGMLARPKPAPPATERRAEALQRAPVPLPPLAADTAAGVAAEKSPPLAVTQSPVDITRHVAELENAAPAAWLERVRVLRRDGRTAEAETLLTEFRKRYPAERIPADLQ
jgi:hypothetical protein